MDIASLLVTVILWGLVFYVIWWGIGKIALPEPFAKVALALFVLLVVVVLLNILGVVGTPYRLRL